MEIVYSKHFLFHAGLNMIAMSVTGVGVCAFCIIMLIAVITRIVNSFSNALTDERSQIISFVNL